MPEAPLGMDLTELLRHLVAREGSDLHVKVGARPHVRVGGVLEPAPFEPPTPADVEAVLAKVLPAARATELAQTGSTDVAVSVAGLGRFRVDAYRQRGSIGLAVRWVRPGIPALGQLGLPDVVCRLAEESRGLVLVAGPGRSGRTTTVAAMLDHLNASRAVHIVTVEEPIEYLHPDKQSLVSQREVGTDVRTFREGVQRALRQDADVIFVGELRDPETISAAMEAALTDRLVISILGSTTVVDTVGRLLDFYPPHQQRQARQTLATVLRGIVCQRLLERRDGAGRLVAVEVLVHTPRVAELLADPEHFPDPLAESLAGAVAEGQYFGMVTLDHSLLDLCRQGLLDLEQALLVAEDPEELRIAARAAGVPGA
ncbi:MAG: PilT/PilU family type 4a pilus ATPase [Acidimicrobiales bacterium]|nr:PilT/PilU family type 4a pilus ATPase [Acidimicrobiales bacterium]